MKISRRRLAGYLKNICNKKRAARAARLFFLVQPIISSICGVVVVVAVVISQTPFVPGQLALIRALIMLLFVFCPQASDFILLLPFRLPKKTDFPPTELSFQTKLSLPPNKQKNCPCMHNRGQPALGPVSRKSRNFSDDINHFLSSTGTRFKLSNLAVLLPFLISETY